jgi:glycosyltransferase (activator-dependent family)
MKVLFVCTANTTHYYPLVPLAWALRTAGHEVRVAAPPELTEVITTTGLTAVEVGVADFNENGDPQAAQLYEHLLTAGAADLVQHFDFGRGAWSFEELFGVQSLMVSTFFDPMNNLPMIQDLVAFAERWKPDLVIREIYSIAGSVAAHIVGTAHARVVYGPDNVTHVRQPFLAELAARSPQSRDDPAAEWLDRVLARYGTSFDEDVLTGQWIIDLAPPSTRLDHGLRTVGVRYTPFNGPAVVPDWLHERPARRRICITSGLSGRETGDDVFAIGDILVGLDDLDLEIVATVAPDYAGPVPANTRAVEFVPMNDLLPTCELVVHHGGAGTWLTANLHGVPQIIISHGWDTGLKEERLRQCGNGIAVPAVQATPAAIRDAICRVLGQPSYRAAARRLQDELLREPTCNDIVPVLEQLVSERHSGTRSEHALARAMSYAS